MQLQWTVRPGSRVTGRQGITRPRSGTDPEHSANHFYRGEGREGFRSQVTPGLRGVDRRRVRPGSGRELVRRVTRARPPPATTAQSRAPTHIADTTSFHGTPSFLWDTGGGPLQPLNWSSLTPGQFTSKINQLLA